MKIGDLVQLSAYGIARDYNKRITTVDCKMTGLVIKVREDWSFPYTVNWSGVQERFAPKHSRRELKHAHI